MGSTGVRFPVVFGPPAVGKTTIGQLIERATGIRLFHNDMCIEPVLKFFPSGHPLFFAWWPASVRAGSTRWHRASFRGCASRSCGI